MVARGHGSPHMGRRFPGSFYRGPSVVIMPAPQVLLPAIPRVPELLMPIGEGVPGFKKYVVKTDIRLAPGEGEALPTPGVGVLCMSCTRYEHLQPVWLPAGTVLFAAPIDDDKQKGLLSTVLTYSTGERVKLKFAASSVSEAAEGAKSYKDTGTGTGGDETDHVAYFRTVGALLGWAYGLYFAFQKDSGFWGYVGYGLLFNIIGGALGTAGGLTLKAATK